MRGPVHAPSIRADLYLARLADVLKAHGWAVSLTRVGTLPVLRVTDLRAPTVGEGVVVTLVSDATGNRGPWFRSSTGVLLAPCSEPARAEEGICVLLTPLIARALSASRQR
ncbi:hypothetical protein AGRA3207_002509 [Actinomadura graeca]|uniref:Uncharacterized protein n=1 Tax=Actinomadura graeca TaxID=2750812 RepID=A0ABX8QS79_9ACTN|nr:hypothetical protein [Actinomadura graeca]QXJ21635.1 hypothetical protein AGRA3207_002509 [Actinomadura graeca]